MKELKENKRTNVKTSMKVALIMIMCSQIAGECMKPHLLNYHDSIYECLIAGYDEAKKKNKRTR